MKFRILILAAGKGKRMGNREVPKALTLIAGKPILQYLVESVEASGVDGPPLVVTGPEGTRLCDGFGGTCDYVTQMQQLGTGHAVQVAQKSLADAEAIIVLYGDHPFIRAETITRLAKRHAMGDNAITMMSVMVPHFEDWYAALEHWGRLLRDPHTRHISANVEYKDATDSQRAILEVNPSIYCFDARWLWENIETLRPENAAGEYYLTDLISIAVQQGRRISALSMEPQESLGINTPQERETAERIYRTYFAHPT